MVVNKAESSNNCQAAKKFGVTECNVRRWRAPKQRLKDANSQRKSYRGPQMPLFHRTCSSTRLDSTRHDTTRHGSSTGRFPPQIVPPGRGRGRLRERAVTYFCTRRKQHLRNPHMERTHITTMEDIDNITIISWHVEEVEEVEYVGCGAAMAVTSMVAMSLS